MLRFFTLLFCIFFWGSVQGQTKAQIRKADRLFKDRGEIHFWFRLKKASDQQEVTRVVSIDQLRGDTVFAFANKRGLLRLFELGYSRIHLLSTPAEEYRKQTKDKSGSGTHSTQLFDSYPTYTQYEQIMQDFESQYPALCKRVLLGTLPSGRKIMALKISDSVNVREKEPRFLYTSSMHGDETAGYPLMLKLADLLLSSYSSNSRIQNLVSQCEIWINPLANPDGTYRSGNATVSGATRFNSANIDLNRNYPDPQDGPHPDGEAYQPETRIFMALADSLDFSMAANFHGGAEVANFPWDTWQRRNADESWWIQECVKFADSARANAPGNFFNQNFGYPNLPGVTQGFDWYEVNGGRQDYMNWFKGCKELTVELSNVKLIADNQINNHWNYYRESLLGFMEASLRGFRGTVTDQCTGLPVRARVRIPGHDKDSSHVYSYRQRGDYYRPIDAGTWNLEFSAPGYQTVLISNLTIADGQSVVQNVQLQPLSPKANFEVLSSDPCALSVQFQENSGSASQWIWSFGDGNASTQRNPSHSYAAPGNYLVKLKVSNCAGSDSLTMANPLQIQAALPPVLTGDSSICGARPHQLQASSSSPLVVWYANATGGLPLDSGLTFTTSPLNSSTTYFAQSINPLPPGKAGAVNNAIGTGGYFTANTYHYLIFNASIPFRLRSVLVYANTAGNRTIQVRNSQGVVLQSRVVNIPQGSNRINLNFDIPAGEGFQLGVSGGQSNNLYRNNAGASYPYTYSNWLGITGNSAGNSAIYYFFYDWEISSQCQSPRSPVRAAVGNAPQPGISITASSLSICEGDTLQLNSELTQVSGPLVSWKANGGTIGTGSNLSWPATLTGNVQIAAQVLSSDTCAVLNPASSNPLSVSVLPRPSSPVIFQSGAYLLAGQPVIWYLNGSALSGPANDSLLVSESGTYAAMALGVNGCRSAFSNLLSITGIQSGRGNRLWMRVLENQVEVSGWQGAESKFRLLDLQGRIIQEGSFSNGGFRILTSGLSSGAYRIQVEGHPEVLTFTRP